MRKNKPFDGPSAKEFIAYLVGLPSIQKAENERYYKDEEGGINFWGYVWQKYSG